MTDDKTKRGPADRSRINVNEPYELDYWSKEFDLTPEQLRQLVAWKRSADELAVQTVASLGEHRQSSIHKTAAGEWPKSRVLVCI